MTKKERAFVKTVRDFYKQQGRDLPWRKTTDPYKVLVSEVMLQQTQVDRVIPKYTSFLKQFPTLKALARADLKDVLKEWQGLGYNRRAKALHDVSQQTSRLPRDYDELCKLPGIGPYTAGAIRAFAYNEPEPIIETNIRTVYTHHFFPGGEAVHDSEIVKLIERTLDRENPREWYSALMDYGSHLKKKGIKINSKSAHYTKQSGFKGSNREVRGAVVRELSQTETGLTPLAISQRTGLSRDAIQKQIDALVNEGLLRRAKRVVVIA